MTAAVGAFALGLVAVAQAQSPAPTIPNPANPTPPNPVASDGTPLPRHGGGDALGLFAGRSVFAPAGAFMANGRDVLGTAPLD